MAKELNIQAEDHRIWYDEPAKTVFFQGFVRLEGMKEYQPIMELMLQALDQSSAFILNLEALEFLNSSGISMLSMFVVKVREKGEIQLTIQGSKKVLWQTKSLRNLQRLMPSLTLDLL